MRRNCETITVINVVTVDQLVPEMCAMPQLILASLRLRSRFSFHLNVCVCEMAKSASK